MLRLMVSRTLGSFTLSSPLLYKTIRHRALELLCSFVVLVNKWLSVYSGSSAPAVAQTIWDLIPSGEFAPLLAPGDEVQIESDASWHNPRSTVSLELAWKGDRLYEGDCDDAVWQLCALLGWEEQLQAVLDAAPKGKAAEVSPPELEAAASPEL